jgi:hypothetical protein
LNGEDSATPATSKIHGVDITFSSLMIVEEEPVTTTIDNRPSDYAINKIYNKDITSE